VSTSISVKEAETLKYNLSKKKEEYNNLVKSLEEREINIEKRLKEMQLVEAELAKKEQEFM